MEPAPTSSNFIDSLPDDMHQNILSFLDEKSLGRYCQVSKKWNKQSTTDDMWISLYPGIEHVKPLGFLGTVKEYIGIHNIKLLESENDLTMVFGIFCKKLRVETNETFECIFPFNINCEFKVEHKHRDRYDPTTDHKVVYMLGKALLENKDFVDGAVDTHPVSYACTKFKASWPKGCADYQNLFVDILLPIAKQNTILTYADYLSNE